MNNPECKIRPEIINTNSNESSFYPYSILINKYSGSCNNINGPYAKLCVSNVVKDMNIKVFNLISKINETRHVSWHETCKSKWRLDASVCINKKCWNNDKCRCKCKELIDKVRFDNGFIWNPIIYECECDKLCDVGEYLDSENCKCRKRLSDKLVEECSEDINRNNMIYNVILNDHRKVWKSCTVYIVLIVIGFFNNHRH